MRIFTQMGFAGLALAMLAGSTGFVSAPAFGAIERFAQVSPGIYRGGIPESEADYVELKKLGVKTVLSLESTSMNIDWDRGNARKQGMRFINAPMTPMFLQPEERSVDLALKALADPSLRPIFIHCYQGKDRTGMAVALWRVFAEKWSPARAYKEWEDFGYDPDIFVGPFADYFWARVNGQPFVRRRTTR